MIAHRMKIFRMVLTHAEYLHSVRDHFLLGLLSGLTILGDGKFLFFSGLIVFWMVFLEVPRRPLAFRKCLSFVLGVTLIVGGWSLRNKIVHGNWVMISPQSGLSLYIGNNPQATGIFENPGFIRPTHFGQDEDERIMAETIAKKKMTPAQVSQFWKDQAFSFIKDQPVAYIKLLGKKIIAFASENESSYDVDLLLQKELKTRWDLNPWFILFPVAVIGIVVSLRSSVSNVYLLLLILSQIITTLIFFLTFRHRTSILPIFLVYEACGVFWIVDQIYSKRYVRVILSAGAVVLCLCVFGLKKVDAKIIDFIYETKTALTYDHQKKYVLAKEHYEKALMLRPDDTNTYYNLGNIYLNQGDYEGARKYYEIVVKTCAHHVDARFNLAVVYENLGYDQKAIELFRSVLDLQPQDLTTYYRLGNLYRSIGNCQESQFYYGSIISKNSAYRKDLEPFLKKCPE